MNMSVLATLLRIVVSVAGLILAFVGFSQAFPSHGPRPLGAELDLAYQSVQLIFGRFPEELRGRPIPMALQVARFALPATAALVTLSLAWEHLRGRARAFVLHRRGGHLVVFGEGRLADGLVRGERARKGGVVAWVEQGDGRLARDAEALGAVRACGPIDGFDLKVLGLDAARTFVAAADSDSANLAASRRVMDHALAHRKPGEPLRIIARIDDLGLRDTLEQRLARERRGDRVALRLASAPQLVARQFLLANPVDRVRPAAGQPLRLAWIGWSPVAEALLVRILASVHLRGERRLELVVADVDAARAEQGFLSRRPGAFEIATIRFEPLDGDAPKPIAEQVARRALGQLLSAVYVTLADPSAALSTALALETAFAKAEGPSPAIYAWLPEAGEHAAGVVDDSLVRPFGAISGIADPEALMQERADGFARSIHAFYLQGRLNEGEALGERPTLAEWNNLPEAVREDNRLVADCYLVKLRDVGARVAEGEGPPIRFTPEEVEGLAEAEHRRWMAAKLLDGWALGERRDDAARLHPDLIPYEVLDERIKDLDREQVRMIPRILAASGQRALRDLTVELAAPEGAVSRADVRSSLEAVARDYPDRRIVVQADPAEAGGRAVLLPAQALGYACRLQPSAPLRALIDGAPPVERGALAHLARNALGIEPASERRPADLSVDVVGATLASLRRSGQMAAAR